MRIMAASSALALTLLSVGRVTHAADTQTSLPPEMTGHFTGVATIVVNWTMQRQLLVDVFIRQDGTVEGMVGDAAIRDGRLRRNRGRIGRALNLATDWIVVGRLEGDVIAAERIRRDGVKIPLDFVASQYRGGVNTSGSKIGGKSTMVLAATNLRLARIEGS